MITSVKAVAPILFLVSTLMARGATAPVDYLREVKPLLTGHCAKCHASSQQKGGLRLDTAAFALKGGEHGPSIQAGRGSDSLLIQAVEGTHDDISRMPYKKPPLTTNQIAVIRRWIDEGAHAPADEIPANTTHWAFVAPVRPAVPQSSSPPAGNAQNLFEGSTLTAFPSLGVPPSGGSSAPPPEGGTPNRSSDSGSDRANAIDAFIRSRLAKEGIKPSPEADRATLIRRVSLDLIGLPPTPEEVDDFVNDRRPDAFERVVDRLLASSHHGERWGRWWLDAARYADSNGYSIDAPRPIWKYRDWVVDALNRDLPFNQFVSDQLAGDLRPNATVEHKIATGFHRNTQINQEGGIDPEQFRVEAVIDRVNTTATVFLGVTLACAQCHDHKFDPFTQREYYRMFAFFNSQIEDGHGKAAPAGMMEVPGEFEPTDGVEKEIVETQEELDRYLNTKGSALQKWEQGLAAEEAGKLEPDVQSAMKIPFADRTLEQKRSVYAAYRADDAEFNQRNGRLVKLLKREPKPVTTLVMQELPEPRETHLLVKGDFTRPGELLSPGVPAVLDSSPANSNTNRLDLARWIVSTNNPLTARVLVNRVWQQYFGTGIVETENDFGTQGSPPTNPELLDWLACEFMHPEFTIKHRASSLPNPGWSLKHLHRLIVTSATYRQSSKARPDLREVDPNNKLLARQNRLRLDAEAVRDVELSISGLLSPKQGGPPVYPPQPDGVMTLGQVKRAWKASEGEDRHRRGIYTHFWRATPHPALAVFDAPDAFSACTRRIRSNTPLQALTLLNDQQYSEMAVALAARLLAAADSDAGCLDHAFRLCLARPPAMEEKARLQSVLDEEMRQLTGDEKARRAGAWMTVARVLLNLDETITRE